MLIINYARMPEQKITEIFKHQIIAESSIDLRRLLEW